MALDASLSDNNLSLKELNYFTLPYLDVPYLICFSLLYPHSLALYLLVVPGTLPLFVF